MIKLIKSGKYSLICIGRGRNILYLSGQGYHWNYAKGIGDILTFSKHPHRPFNIITQGNYRIYDVKDEPNYTDLQHLELSILPNKWQGYLLFTGLPTFKKIRSRILPTNEIIAY